MYVISRQNTVFSNSEGVIFSVSEYVTKNGYGHTLHLDKAAKFPTLEAAAHTQKLHFKNHVITEVRG
jgi:hypothetical protein